MLSNLGICVRDFYFFKLEFILCLSLPLSHISTLLHLLLVLSHQTLLKGIDILFKKKKKLYALTGIFKVRKRFHGVKKNNDNYLVPPETKAGLQTHAKAATDLTILIFLWLFISRDSFLYIT